MGNRSSSTNQETASSSATISNIEVTIINSVQNPPKSTTDYNLQVVDPSDGCWERVNFTGLGKSNLNAGQSDQLKMQTIGVYGLAQGGTVIGRNNTPFVFFGWTVDLPTSFLYFGQNTVSNNSCCDTGGIRMINIQNCTGQAIDLFIAGNGAFQPTGFSIGATKSNIVGFLVGTIISFDGDEAPRNTNDVYTIGFNDSAIFVQSDDLGGINNKNCIAPGTIPTDDLKFIQRYRWVIILLILGIIIFVIIIVIYKARKPISDAVASSAGSSQGRDAGEAGDDSTSDLSSTSDAPLSDLPVE